MPATHNQGGTTLKARHTWIAAVAALIALGCGSGGGDEAAPPDPSSSAPAQADAQAVVAAISARWPAPNASDTSEGCRSKPGDSAAGCEARITTDAVTVLEFADEKIAARWTKQLSKTGDTRQVGRFVLSWTARDQDLTSDEARDSMVAITKDIAG